MKLLNRLRSIGGNLALLESNLHGQTRLRDEFTHRLFPVEAQGGGILAHEALPDEAVGKLLPAARFDDFQMTQGDLRLQGNLM